MRSRVEASVLGPARAGWLRIVLAPGAGQADGGVHIDIEARLVPEELRMPNALLWVELNDQPSVVAVSARSPSTALRLDAIGKPTPAELLERTLDFMPPTGWVRVDLPSGLAYAPAGELEGGAGNLELVATSIAIQVVPSAPGQTPEAAAHALMRRRVPAGDLPKLRADIDGTPAFGFDWTDGVRDIFSFFVLSAEGVLIELSASASAIPAVEPGADILIRGLLSSVRWRS